MTAEIRKLQKAGAALFGKVYELSLIKGYVARWSMPHAVRELIQNALDSDSPFVYEFAQEEDGLWALRLNSEFATLTPQTLLLGATSKADTEEAIGSFGEGYKIALLVLTREGYDTEVLNGDLLWRPRFRFSRTFGEEILIIEETVAPENTNRGLTFVVHGLDDKAVEEIKSSCLKMQLNVGAIKRTRYGDILLDQPGRLYVGALFICNTELKYGYNLLPKYIQLERDRQTVSTFDLKNVTVKCWFETGEHERVAGMISEEVEDVEYARYDSPELVKEACYRIFRERHPESFIAASPAEAKKMIEDGLVDTVYVGGGMYSAVSESKSYRAERPAFERTGVAPHIALASFLKAHRSEMHTPAIVAFKALILEAQRKWVLK